MIGFYISIFGTFLIVASILIAFSTSMGGTRSDYSDGAGCFAFMGMIVIFGGAVYALVDWIVA